MLNYLRNKTKAIMITVAVVFAATMLYGIGYQGMKGGTGQNNSQRKGLASVNGQDVDLFRYNQIINRYVAQAKGGLDPVTVLYIQSRALSELIDFTIIAQEAHNHFGSSGAEVDKAVQDIMQANKIPDIRTFDQILRSQGFTLENLKRMIRDEIVVQRYVGGIKNNIVLTNDDMREVRALHILIMPGRQSGGNDREKDDNAKKKAEMVLGMAKSGSDFGELAKKYSDDPGSAKNGGDLGFFKKGAMVPEFDSIVFSLRPGEISGIVKSPFGYHIIKMIESRLIKDANKDKLLEEKRQRIYDEAVYGLKKKAKIEIFNRLINAFDLRIRGDNAAALDEYRKAVKETPSNPYAHLFLAGMLSQEKSSSEAMAEYREASSNAGADPYVHVYVGKAYLSAGLDTLARQEFSQASLVAGDDPKIHENLAKFFKQLKMTKAYDDEKEKLKQIADREQFENEIKQKAAAATLEAK